MPGELDNVGREVSEDLIGDFGTTVSFTYVTDAGDFDPSDGSVTGRTTSTSTLSCLVKEPEKAYANGDVADSDAVTLLIPAAPISFTPKAGDSFVFNGDTYTVWSVETVQPGILPIMFKAHAIRGTER